MAQAKAQKEAVAKTSGRRKIHITPGVAIKPATAAEMAARTVALILTVSRLGNQRKVDNNQVEVDAEKELVVVTKRLLEAEQLEAVWSIEGEVRSYLNRRALPSMLKRGVYLLPVELIVEVEDRLKQFQEDHRKAVDVLVEVYSDVVATAKKRLRTLFNKDDYPSPETVRNSFQLQWRYISFNVPASLEQINRELYEQERKKAEESWSETREMIQALLRGSLAQMVNHMVDKLTPDPGGKKKKFKNSSINKLQDFLTAFDARNITNDVQMKTLVDKAKQLVVGIDPDSLRENEGLRQQVQKGFSDISKMIAPLIEEAPTRAIHFEEEA